MTKNEKAIVNSIKQAVKSKCDNTKHLTLKTIATVLDDTGRSYLTGEKDFTDSHQTKLYQSNSTCYCVLLEVIASMEILYRQKGGY